MIMCIYKRLVSLGYDHEADPHFCYDLLCLCVYQEYFSCSPVSAFPACWLLRSLLRTPSTCTISKMCLKIDGKKFLTSFSTLQKFTIVDLGVEKYNPNLTCTPRQHPRTRHSPFNNASKFLHPLISSRFSMAETQYA